MIIIIIYASLKRCHICYEISTNFFLASDNMSNPNKAKLSKERERRFF